MLSLVVSAAIVVSPAAKRDFIEYATMTQIVGSCAEYIDKRDIARLTSENKAMPPQLAYMLDKLYWKGLSEPASFEVCKAVMPKTMRLAKYHLDYELMPVVQDYSALIYINDRFGK